MSSKLSSPRWVAGLPRSFGGVQRDVDHLFEHFFGSANGGSSAARWLAPAAMSLAFASGYSAVNCNS